MVFILIYHSTTQPLNLDNSQLIRQLGVLCLLTPLRAAQQSHKFVCLDPYCRNPSARVIRAMGSVLLQLRLLCTQVPPGNDTSAGNI